jgi:hypothetical protein
MNKRITFLLVFCLVGFLSFGQSKKRKTEVSIKNEKFYINGQPTLKGKKYQGYSLEGLLPNSRMVQGIFDDLNPETRSLWNYVDGKPFDADRNTREYVQAMKTWKDHGLLAITMNLQGGSPQGYSKEQPWHNSAITETGDLRPDYMNRLEKILDRADGLNMVVMLGIFYFGQDQRLKDEAAVIRAVDNTIDWLFDKGYRNVMIEINNECNVSYDHAILQPERVHELIERVKGKQKNGYRFLVSTSYGGTVIPKPNVVKTADYLLLHGNGVNNPERIVEMVQKTKQVEGYTPKPIVFNEDDHFNFDQPMNNFMAATSAYASWGYFDYRMKDEGFAEGYQSMPADWGINSERKKGFFSLLKQMTK